MSWALHLLCAEILPKAVGNKTCLTLFIGLNLCSSICAMSLTPTTLYCGMFILYLCLLKCRMWYDFCHKTCLSFVYTLSKHWSHILIVKGLSVLQLIAFVMLQKKTPTSRENKNFRRMKYTEILTLGADRWEGLRFAAKIARPEIFPLFSLQHQLTV